MNLYLYNLRRIFLVSWETAWKTYSWKKHCGLSFIKLITKCRIKTLSGYIGKIGPFLKLKDRCLEEAILLLLYKFEKSLFSLQSFICN